MSSNIGLMDLPDEEDVSVVLEKGADWIESLWDFLNTCPVSVRTALLFQSIFNSFR